MVLDEFPLKATHAAFPAGCNGGLARRRRPGRILIDRDCELKAVGEEKSAVRYVRHPLSDEMASEIKAHLAAGKLPTKLA